MFVAILVFLVPSAPCYLLVLIFLILGLGLVRPNPDTSSHVVSFPTETLNLSRSDIFILWPSNEIGIILSIYASTWHESSGYGLPLMYSTRPCAQISHMCSCETHACVSFVRFFLVLEHIHLIPKLSPTLSCNSHPIWSGFCQVMSYFGYRFGLHLFCYLCLV